MVKLFRVFKTLKSSHKYFLVQYIRDYFIIIQINGLFFNTLEIILLCNVLSHYLLNNLNPLVEKYQAWMLFISIFTTTLNNVIFIHFLFRTTLTDMCPDSFFRSFSWYSLRLALFVYRLICRELTSYRKFFRGSLLKLKLKFWSNVLYLGRWAQMG